jgi:hypothetical protein
MISLTSSRTRFDSPPRSPIASRPAVQPAGALPSTLFHGRAPLVDEAAMIADPVLRAIAVAEAELRDGILAQPIAA